MPGVRHRGVSRLKPVVDPMTGVFEDALDEAASRGEERSAELAFILGDAGTACAVQLVLDCDYATYLMRLDDVSGVAERLGREYGSLERADDPAGAYAAFVSDEVVCTLMPGLLFTFEHELRALGLIASTRPPQVPPDA